MSSTTAQPALDESMTWRVLIVDDLPVWAHTVQDFSTLFNCQVRHATNLTQATRELARWRPHLLLLDLHMPRDEWQPLPTIRRRYRPDEKSLAFCAQVTSEPFLKDVLVVFTSVEQQQEEQEAALDAGAHAFYTKESFSADVLRELLLYLQTR